MAREVDIRATVTPISYAMNEEFLADQNSSDSNTPTQHAYTQIQIIIACVYAVLFMLGEVGNFYVIGVLCHVLRIDRNPKASIQLVRIYVLILSLLDAFTLTFLPIIIFSILQATWSFGFVVCKLFIATDIANKLLSPCMLLGLSAGRYYAVANPNSAVYRAFQSGKSMAFIFACWLCFAGIIFVPLVYYSRVTSNHALFVVLNKKNEPITVQVDDTMCVIDAPDLTVKVLGCMLFLFGCVAPGSLISVYYCGLLRYVYMHTRNNRCATVSTSKVTRSIVVVTVFFYICWTPYWTMGLVSTFASEVTHNESFSLIAYAVHALPYLNSAINPVLYAMLNTQLWSVDRAANVRRPLLNLQTEEGTSTMLRERVVSMRSNFALTELMRSRTNTTTVSVQSVPL